MKHLVYFEHNGKIIAKMKMTFFPMQYSYVYINGEKLKVFRNTTMVEIKKHKKKSYIICDVFKE